MAQTREFPAHSHIAPSLRTTNYLRILIILATLVLASLIVPASRAQLQQPLVFSSAGAVASRNDQTGLLTPVAGSPFTAANQALAIDVQGRYLFAIGTTSIHMYEITNPTTGAYQEVANSPFASSVTNQPAYVAVEPTGQFIAVVNRVGENPGDGLVETFQISPSAPGGPALIPVAGSGTELDSTAIGFAQPPNNKTFLIFMGANPQSSNMAITQGSEFQTLSIDPSTGLIAGYQQDAALSQRGLSFAMDPQGRYYVTGTQDNLLEFGIIQLVGIGGDALLGNIQLPEHNYPDGLWVDSTGTFVYAAINDLSGPDVVNIYSVNLQTGVLTETASSPLPSLTSVPPYFADPTGSFNYGFGADQNTAIAYTVDPQTGYFIETANSPFTIPQINGSLSFSIPPGQQGVSGPSILLSPASLSFVPIQTGTSSTSQTIALTSNGSEALSVNSISLAGADPSQFQESDTCQAPSALAPTKFCSISLTFAPTATGPQQAMLSITDNAPGSPQTVALTGTGTAPPPPAPVVTVTPDPVSFPTTAQGTPSSPIAVSVTNSGNLTLHISSVVLGGNNPGDFSMTNQCSGPYAANASCMIAVTFTPLAAGQRSAIISITDDASNSPQSIQVSGMATSTTSTTPAVSLSSTSLSFAAITQGTSSAGQNVTVTNSGGGPLHISSVVLGGANSGDFILTNGCTAAAYAVNANCTLGVSFAPLTSGARSATVTLTDDAANSPQVINLGGFANPALTLGAAPSGSTTATISAGQTAQFNLQITPGPGYSGTISLAYSGAPAGASIQGPSTLQVSNGNAATFTVSVTTSAGTSSGLPFFNVPRSIPFPILRAATGLTIAFVLLLILAFGTKRDSETPLRRGAFSNAVSAIIFLMMLCATWTAAGCGGGSAMLTTAPPQIVTPQGQFTIIVIPSATSANGKPLQLQPIQLTLTVN
jgi:Abnormal spindle-like microcephaly-assoc'd, ASPM-SPD-2-Hydin